MWVARNTIHVCSYVVSPCKPGINDGSWYGGQGTQWYHPDDFEACYSDMRLDPGEGPVEVTLVEVSHVH